MIDLLAHVDQTGIAWMRQAACAGMPVELWFPENVDAAFVGYSPVAVRTCAACPVRTECLMYAVKHGITDGMWGGVPPKKRRGRRFASATHQQLVAGTRVRCEPLALYWTTVHPKPYASHIATKVDSDTRQIQRVLEGKIATMETGLAFRIARAIGASPARLWPGV